MSIQNDANTLKSRIITALEATTLKDGKIIIDESTGKVTKADQTPALKHPSAVPNISIGAEQPKYQQKYTVGEQVGIDVLVEIIVREVLSYLEEKVEIVFKERIDNHSETWTKLLNTLIAQLSSFPIVPPTVAATPLTNTNMNAFLLALTTALGSKEIDRTKIKGEEIAQGTHIK